MYLEHVEVEARQIAAMRVGVRQRTDQRDLDVGLGHGERVVVLVPHLTGHHVRGGWPEEKKFKKDSGERRESD